MGLPEIHKYLTKVILGAMYNARIFVLLNIKAMLYTSILLEDQKIEWFGNMLGLETIKVNGKTVSSQFSLFGGKHVFIIGQDAYELSIRTTLFGVVFDLFKNDIPIIESAKGGCAVFMGMIILTALLLLDYLWSPMVGPMVNMYKF